MGRSNTISTQTVARSKRTVARSAIVLASIWLLSGCKPSSSPQVETTNGDAVSASSKGEDCIPQNSPTMRPIPVNRPITFNQDILPILRSKDRGEHYRCVTCHAAYGEVEGPNSQSEVNKIIDSISNRRMPVNGGDCVKPGYIDLLKSWARGGFLEGPQGY